MQRLAHPGTTHRLAMKQATFDFPASASRKVTTQPTRFVLYPGLRSDARGASDERAGRPRAPERRVRRAGGKTPRPGAARATSGREDPAPRSGACDDRAGRPGTPLRRERRAGGKTRHPAAARHDANGGRAPSVRGPRLRARPQSAGRSDLARHLHGSPKTPQ